MKFSKAKERPDGSKPSVDIAIPTFGYPRFAQSLRNHILIDQRFGLIRNWQATEAAAYEGECLREGLLDKANTASSVWADTVYRSKANDTFIQDNGFVSCVHRKKPKGRAMACCTAMVNSRESNVRSYVEQVFAELKSRMGLIIRIIGTARSAMKIAMANIVCRVKRLICLEKAAMA